VNPVLEIQNTWDKTIDYTYREVGNVYAEVNFLKYLTFRGTWYADLGNQNKRQYTPLYYAYNPVDNTPYLYSQQTKLLEDDNDTRKFQQDYLLTFKKAFGDHSLTVLGGFTTYYFGFFDRQVLVTQPTGAGSVPIPNDPRFWYVNSALEWLIQHRPSKTYSNQYMNILQHLVLVACFITQIKYYINASFRDASSQIPEKIAISSSGLWVLPGNRPGKTS
jgi:hypothetical protein